VSIKQIAKGTALIGFISVARLLVQLFSVPVIARFLSPEDYGLTAMAMPVILFLMMIADAGLGTSLVRCGKMDKSAWHSCFWISAGLGILVAILLALLSPVVSFILNEPRLTSLVMALAAIIPLQTLTLVPGAALQQQGRFGTIARIEIATMCASIGSAVCFAVMGYGVWALIWQQIVFFTVRLALTLTCSPYRPRLIFDLRDAWEHVVFGRDLLGVSVISFVSRSLENITIGKIYGPGPVGIYSMAFQFARLPFMLVTGPLQYVLYPHIAAIREDKPKLTALFLLLTRVLAMGFLPAVGLVAVASEPIFHLLLSKKWSQAAPVFVLIAPAAALQPVTAILGTFLMALGRTDVQMRIAARFAAVWLVGLMLSVWYGIEAVAATYSLCAIISSLWSLRVGLPYMDCSFAKYMRAFLWPIILTALGIIVYWIVSATLTNHEIAKVFLAITLAVIASVIALVAQFRDVMAAFSLPHAIK
jgi:O-antigen/teichoic acid export membrane protein